MVTRHPYRRISRLLASAAIVSMAGLALAACKTTSDTTGSITAASASAPRSEADWRRDAEALGRRYEANPGDVEAALQYAQALRATGQRNQAASVLQQSSLRHPNNTILLGAYGRALADVGQFSQALDVLSRAHTPDRPDWRVLSAQGAVLDQLGRHQDAQRYYASALKIVPNEPSVLSNLGLSHALAKDLPTAETTLRRAAQTPNVDQRIRQNLALVVGLQGRYAEAETIARADLPADAAAANVAYLKQMLSQHDDLRTAGAATPPKSRAARTAGPRISSGPSL